jgi:hypothetical protein
MLQKSRLFAIPLLTVFLVAFAVVNVGAQLFVNAHQITDNDLSDRGAVLAVDGQDVVHFAWIRNNTLLLYMNSSLWQEVLIANNVSDYAPSIFIDNADVVYVSWTDKRNAVSNGYYGNTDVYYAKSSDGWVNQLVTAATDFRVHATEIAVQTNGDVHMTYIRETSETLYNQQVFYANLSGSWIETQVSNTPYARIRSDSLSMDIGLTGIVHVAFCNEVVGGDPTDTNHIWYANSSSGWNNVQIDSDATPYTYDDRILPAIEVDSNNVPHIVWTDGRNVNQTYPSKPNRQELYYANSSSGWMNTEIALPNDDPMHSVKLFPSVVMNDSVVHAVWLHRVSPDDYYGDVYYGNSLNWSQAIHVTNYETLGETVSVGITQDALDTDSMGTMHVVWHQQLSSLEQNGNGVSDDDEIYYATLGREGPVGGDILPIDTLALIAPIIGSAIVLCSLAASVKKYLNFPSFLKK